MVLKLLLSFRIGRSCSRVELDLALGVVQEFFNRHLLLLERDIVLQAVLLSHFVHEVLFRLDHVQAWFEKLGLRDVWLIHSFILLGFFVHQ